MQKSGLFREDAMHIRIGGRQVKVSRIPEKLSLFLPAAARSFRWFKNPVMLLNHYFHNRSPAKRLVELRNGIKIHFSCAPDDLSTVVVVFLKKDYGEIPKRGVVIDIGANIGVFSIYAISRGASRVFAFEPNREAYGVLVKNIEENNLRGRILPFNFAVGGGGYNTINIPRVSSAHNQTVKLVSESQKDQYETVSCTTLEKILSANRIEQVDLLKMDCEGAEYEILDGASDRTLSVVQRLRMEYHGQPIRETTSRLSRLGYTVENHSQEPNNFGIIWYSR